MYTSVYQNIINTGTDNTVRIRAHVAIHTYIMLYDIYRCNSNKISSIYLPEGIMQGSRVTNRIFVCILEERDPRHLVIMSRRS